MKCLQLLPFRLSALSRRLRTKSTYAAFALSWLLSGVAVAQGPWSSAADMPEVLHGYSAAAANGKIYVTGGCVPQPTPWSANASSVCRARSGVWVFDPATDSWSSVGESAGSQKMFHVSAAVNGEILVTSGARAFANDPDGMDMALRELSATSKFYDPATDSWRFAANVPVRKTNSAGATANGKLYVFGGLEQPLFFSNWKNVDAYDPATNTWSAAPPMPTTRVASNAVALDGLIYVMGGFGIDDAGAGQWHTSMDAFDPVSGTWTQKASMSVPRFAHAAAVLDGKIYVFGGVQVPPPIPPIVRDFALVERYDPVTDTWEPMASGLPTPRRHVQAATIGDKIYVMGGDSLSSSLDWSFCSPGCPRSLFNTRVDVYDPSLDQVAVSTEASAVPNRFSLLPNYPNPFNPATMLTYELAASGPVRLTVSDLLGREVAVLVDGPMTSGRHEVRFDARGLPAGIYLARLATDQGSVTRPMTLLP